MCYTFYNVNYSKQGSFMARIIDSDFLHRALLHFYGYSSFRTGQEEIISEILHGQPVLAVLPTGAGKSICFQLPSLLL